VKLSFVVVNWITVIEIVIQLIRLPLFALKPMCRHLLHPAGGGKGISRKTGAFFGFFVMILIIPPTASLP
jgi:hypothetical protein